MLIMGEKWVAERGGVCRLIARRVNIIFNAYYLRSISLLCACVCVCMFNAFTYVNSLCMPRQWNTLCLLAIHIPKFTTKSFVPV